SVFLAMFFIGFAFKITDEYSRVWLISWVSLVVVTLSAVRVYMGHLVRKMAASGQLSRKVIVMGMGREAKRLLSRLEQTAFPWIHVVGVFDTAIDDEPSGAHFSSGSVDDLLAYARHNQVDDIIIALPGLSEEHLRVLVDRLEVLPVNITLSLDLIGVPVDRNAVSAYGRLPVVNMKMRPLEGWLQVVKFLEDRILGLIIFTLISPVMAIIAVLIKLESPGPVFFKQDRYGFNNRLIKVYKFRTMYSDQTDANAEKLATRNDPRITRLGRFLRRTSLDELPQFINVLKGDMSIVGPRPHALKASAAGRLYDEVVDNYAKRHRVKPGITGWAQVMGWRGETDTEEKILKRVEYDLDYIEHWSLSFDLKIILQTIFGGFSGRNAF
ncbi:MAG TPA: undecaprenyl-phosphate glucose phosphotransferase, partial [Gammaproteobacteria bacterium]|nr:undecaprenyl-phosphate glucose phosphotransferase [Gammaproteobacteria bacterium]